MVFARYADTTIAQRHLERLTTAVLLAGNEDVQAANAAAAQRYTDLAQQLITVSRETYRRLVETPGFADVLAQASPAGGDRGVATWVAPGPAQRRIIRPVAVRPARHSLGLRLVPDPRQHPRLVRAGFGVGRDRGHRTCWARPTGPGRCSPALIDIAEMSLAKSNRSLAEGFLDLAGRPDITAAVLTELDLSVEQVLRVLDQGHLLQHKKVLVTAIALRGPYVDALSQLQLRALREVRAASNTGDWHRLLLLTVNGAAAGLQNTG